MTKSKFFFVLFLIDLFQFNSLTLGWLGIKFQYVFLFDFYEVIMVSWSKSWIFM